MYARSVYDYSLHTVIVSRWTCSDSSSLLTFQISRSDIPVWLNLWFCSLTTTNDLGRPVSVAMSDFSFASEGLNYKTIDNEGNNNKNNKEPKQ
jgi:hypothetical protein